MKIIKYPKIVKVKYPKIIKPKIKKPKIIKKKKIEPIDKYRLFHSYESAVNLITALIKDSKDNLLTRMPEKSKGKMDHYFVDSMNFLLNRNGLLKYYLEFIHDIELEHCLQELKRFAAEIYFEKVKNGNKKI